MRLFINATSSRTGGGVAHLTWLLHALAKIESELEIVVLTTQTPPVGLRGLPVRYQVRPHPADTWPLPRRLVWEETRLPKMIERWGADVYLSFGSFGLLRCPCRQVMICAQPLYFSDRYYREFASKNRLLRLEELGRRALLKATARRADRILTQTEAMRQQIVVQLGVQSERISVIPHGIHDSFFGRESVARSGKMPDTTDNAGPTLVSGILPDRATPASANHRSTVLYVSVHQVHKDFDTLVGAAALLRDRGRSDVQFAFTGSPNDNQFSRATAGLVHELRLEEAVHFVGLVPNDQIHSLYRSADVFAFPSWAETFGIPLVEAMASGLPIVAADIAVNREVAADAAVYHAVSDPDSLAAQISRVLDEPDLRRTIDRGRSRQKPAIHLGTSRAADAGRDRGNRSTMSNRAPNNFHL